MKSPASFGLRILLLAGAAGMVSCTKKDGPPGEGAAPRKTIGVSLLTMTNPFFKEMADAMEAEGKKRGFEVLVTAGELDPARQRDQVQDFLVRKVSAIVLSPCDSKAVGTSIAEANAAGVPVFTADIACMAPGVKVVSHIATDNLEGGRIAGRKVVEALGGKGKVAFIHHPEVESALQRAKGFREEIARAPGISLVATLPGGGDKARSRTAAQDILQAHADLDAIFGVNDPTALGAIAAIEQAGRAGRVKVVGFDGQAEARQAIKDGKLLATVLQYPATIGEKTIDAIARYMTGEKVPAETLIPPGLYREEDAKKDPGLR
jgi:ribose transport system substrate-binding protein